MWFNVLFLMRTKKKDGEENAEEEDEITKALKKGFLLILSIGMIFGSAMTLISPFIAIIPIGLGSLFLIKEVWGIVQSYRES